MHLAEPGCAVNGAELERHEHYVKFLAEIKVGVLLLWCMPVEKELTAHAGGVQVPSMPSVTCLLGVCLMVSRLSWRSGLLQMNFATRLLPLCLMCVQTMLLPPIY